MSKVELYYESIDDKRSNKKPLLPPLSPRNTANLPSSQDGNYSYDHLHHDASDHQVVHQQSVPLSAAGRLGLYRQLEHS